MSVRRPPVLVALLVVLALPASAASASPGGAFLDDDGSIHEAAIEAIAAEGITRGCNPQGNFRFCPSDGVTREQLAAMLVRGLGLALPAGDTTFVDTGDSIFTREIAAIADAGITRGCNPPRNSRFCPTRPVTRAQVAAFLHRAVPDLPMVAPEAGDFVDVPEDDDFARDIAWLARTGVTRGCDPPANTRFCSSAPVTRAQLATFLTRALELTPMPAPPPPSWPPERRSGFEQGGDTWAVVLHGSRDFRDPRFGVLRDLVETIGYGPTGQTDCDRGAPEAAGFGDPSGVYTLSVYYRTRAQSRDAAAAFAAIGYAGAAAEVQTYCLD